MQEIVKIEKLVHGGQGLGTLADGRRVFVWGALPDEEVEVRIIKSKKSYAEALAEVVLLPSPERVQPREPNYLATSPWQIIRLEAENTFKKEIVQELFEQAHVPLPKFELAAAGPEWQYRNKMEYSFWGDDDGLHLALHNRGSHQKTIVRGSELAMPALDEAARLLLAELQTHNPRAGDLKTIVVRCSQKGETVAALYTKLEQFRRLKLPPKFKGLRVYYSNPKSPASVPTKLLYELGDATLDDDLLGRSFRYDADSFFQVNVPAFEAALAQIKSHTGVEEIIDMYAGVGSIGLSVANKKVMLIEADAATAAMARVNAATAQKQGVTAVVKELPAEASPGDYIRCDGSTLIVDPPRAGLHARVVDAIEVIQPPKLIYLSCNPATQVRDLAMLKDSYKIEYFGAFNFFPHTPHVETLAVLVRRYPS